MTHLKLQKLQKGDYPPAHRLNVNVLLSNNFVKVAELRGVKFAQFSDFGLFSPYKTPKKYLPVTSIQPRGYIAE